MTALRIAAVCAIAVLAVADEPVTNPCVSWEKSTSLTRVESTSDLIVAARTYVQQYSRLQCTMIGDVIPCFASDTNTWGHHDYAQDALEYDWCRTWYNGEVRQSNEQYLPKKGPQWQTWKWALTQTGAKIPDNTIRYHNSVMARSTSSPPGECAGKGFTGWAEAKGGLFGSVHFTIAQAPFTNETFEIAICETFEPTPAPPTPVLTTPTPASPGPQPPTSGPPTPTPLPPTSERPTPVPLSPPGSGPPSSGPGAPGHHMWWLLGVFVVLCVVVCTTVASVKVKQHRARWKAEDAAHGSTDTYAVQ